MREYRVYGGLHMPARREPRIRTLAGMIKKGRFIWVDPNIQRGFRRVHTKLYTIAGSAIFSIESDMSTKQVRALMKSKGFEPASIERLLAFGAEIREKLRGPIIALGNPWMDPAVGDGCVPSLTQLANGRYLKTELDWPTKQWPRFYKFLASA